MKWEKSKLVTDQGEEVDAQAPVIVSASRSTDIPAFYSDWFIHRWNAGYVRWTNPFNGSPLYVSFEKVRAVVFWTKNVAPMLKNLDFLDANIGNYYFQYSLNDYEKEHYEAALPSLSNRIETFKRLSDRVGKDRVIWRFDPLFLTKTLGVDELLKRIAHIGEQLHSFTNKLVFSFADISIYGKVKNNLKKLEIDFVEFTPETMIRFSKGLNELNQRWGLELATCAEKVNLDKYGISHNRCIDDELLIQLFSHDSDLMDFLGVKLAEPNLFDQGGGVEKIRTRNMKDKGQRESCGCIMSKDIGQYNTCPHGCIYCYANTSEQLAMRNYHSHLSNRESESIVGV